MPLADHLRELRRRVVISAIAIVLGAVLGWVLFKTTYGLLTQPIEDYRTRHPERLVSLNYQNATAAFSTTLNIAVFTGFIFSSPVWLYQIWAFIVPGLTRKEKRVSLSFIGAAVPLFLLGCAMAFYSLPIVLGVLWDFAQENTTNIQVLSDYMSFVTRFILAFGLAFLLPVFLVALNLVGILPASRMRRGWRVAVFLIFVFSAMMMPTPDPYSMFLLAGPLTVLFFVALGLSAWFDRRKRKNEPEWMHVPDDQASAI